MYSAQVLDHFQNPRNVGELDNASATVEVTNPACGDIMRLSVRVENGCIADVRFKTRGCVTSIACGSMLTEIVQGRPLNDLAKISYQDISEALGGLPPATLHGSQLAANALRALLASLTKGR